MKMVKLVVICEQNIRHATRTRGAHQYKPCTVPQKEAKHVKSTLTAPFHVKFGCVPRICEFKSETQQDGPGETVTEPESNEMLTTA